jgi:hypothetical protein
MNFVSSTKQELKSFAANSINVLVINHKRKSISALAVQLSAYSFESGLQEIAVLLQKRERTPVYKRFSLCISCSTVFFPSAVKKIISKFALFARLRKSYKLR